MLAIEWKFEIIIDSAGPPLTQNIPFLLILEDEEAGGQQEQHGQRKIADWKGD